MRGLSTSRVKYRLLHLDALEIQQKSAPEEQCPFFIKPHHRRRRKRATSERYRVQPKKGCQYGCECNGSLNKGMHFCSNHEESHHDVDDMHFIPREDLYQRQPFIPMFEYYPTYVIWLQNYTRLFSLFDKTILFCKQKVDVGIYDSDARFVFVNRQDEHPQDLFTYNDYLKRHPQIAILHKLPTLNPVKNPKYKIYGYNFFHQVNGKDLVQINHVWSLDNKLTEIRQSFTDKMDMQGKMSSFLLKPFSRYFVFFVCLTLPPDELVS